ncbi:MAG: hypothetical protein PHO91_04625 [Patescibacteria group bacterium]|nr:hypothetical protein [Patescibacteria group bacterium]
MAKIQKKNLDSVRRAPVRRSSYEAPAVDIRKKRPVPKEYQTLSQAPKSRGGFLFFLFLLFIVTLGGFIYWNQKSQEKAGESLEFYVSGPDQVISGQQVSYLIKYKNTDIVTLKQMELNVHWPRGFYFDQASLEPSNSNATTWLLEDLAPGASRSLEIKGQLVGEKGDEVTAFFSLDYQPDNFHSVFKAKWDIVTKISDNNLTLAIVGPDKSLVSVAQEFELVFSNLTSQEIPGLYLDILYPDDWNPDSEQASTAWLPDESFARENNYLLFDLEANEEKTIVLKGSFASGSRSQQALVLEIGNISDGKFRRLARADKQLEVVAPSFDSVLKINGQNSNIKTNWGDTLRYQLEVTNQSGANISDVLIRALLDGAALDWGSLDTVGRRDNSSIVWSKRENADLANWPAGETKIFTWQIKSVIEPVPQRTVDNIIKINIEGLDLWEQVYPSLPLVVGETLVFRNGIYWDLGGRRVGSGLLPPRVGEATQYLVVWSFAEAIGNFDNAQVVSSLPPEVDFISEVDVQDGNLSFNAVSRELAWQLSNFSNSILPLTASFTIELIPTQEMQGQAATLLNPLTVNASGREDLTINSKLLKSSDVIAASGGTIGIVE